MDVVDGWCLVVVGPWSVVGWWSLDGGVGLLLVGCCLIVEWLLLDDHLSMVVGRRWSF